MPQTLWSKICINDNINKYTIHHYIEHMYTNMWSFSKILVSFDSLHCILNSKQCYNIFNLFLYSYFIFNIISNKRKYKITHKKIFKIILPPYTNSKTIIIHTKTWYNINIKQIFGEHDHTYKISISMTPFSFWNLRFSPYSPILSHDWCCSILTFAPQWINTPLR